MRRVKIIIGCIVAFFIILSIIYYYPRKLINEYSGVTYRLGDHNYMEYIKININGHYSRGIIKGDKFEGSMTIGDKQLSKINLRFDEFGRGLLFFYDESTGDYHSYGDIFTKNGMNEITICVLEEDDLRKGGQTWSSKYGLMISAPAESRVEAIEISNQLMTDVLHGELR